MSCRVLIADADLEWLETCELGLGGNGFTVETVRDSLECLGRLLSDPFPDVLVLELDLPWGGGDGVLDWLREEEQTSVLSRCAIIATSKASPALLSRRMKLPVSRCLQKPISLTRLRNAVGSPPTLHPLAASKRCVKTGQVWRWPPWWRNSGR